MRSATGSRRASPSSGRGRTTATTSSPRVSALGWTELWAGELLGATVAGGIELGRRLPPSLIDQATLGRRSGSRTRPPRTRTAALAVPRRGGSLALGPPAPGQVDPHARGSGTVLVRRRARRAQGGPRAACARVERGDARLRRGARVPIARLAIEHAGPGTVPRALARFRRAVTPRRRSARDGRNAALSWAAATNDDGHRMQAVGARRAAA
jgi:hypothetical protein